MRKSFKIVLISSIFVILSGCTTQATLPQKPPIEEKPIQEKTIIKIVKIPVEVPKEKDAKIIIGEAEYVYIPSSKIKLKARIDTGATTTSIHALDIKEFERDGQKWVKFKLVDENKQEIQRALPIQRVTTIKRHAAKSLKRYVVQLRLNLGESSQLVDVTLANRSDFTYPLLIGRNFLNGIFVVDVSKKYIIKTKEI
ncbi:ATP-dependent zinc protease [Malaciobacter mytili]|uniref:ATP-dependent Zn protease n=1 Tax=Malaciobacter mytili LMG 24559 TaxID=1032238 RepID=A0AAX2AJ96_9BACT|nr:ATP-dependent zinc protease [Malaciobacter mytili]AXH15087.1 putative ATP-dependent zinc protease [Malaciobacter mytili LMG 24559]RXK15596.1 ATP-dependent Zn protease [Malaciobacter mytili LMG 24559]